MRGDEALDLLARDPRVGLGEQPVPAGERRRGAVRGAGSSGGPSGSICHQPGPRRRASRRSVGLGPEPAARQRRRVQQDAARARIRLHRVWGLQSFGRRRGCPRPRDAAPRHPDRAREPQVDGGRYPAKRTRGRAGRGLGGRLPRRPRGAAARPSIPRGPGPALARGPHSTHERATTAGRPFVAAAPGPLAVRGRGVGRPPGLLAPRARSGSSTRGRMSSSERAAPRARRALRRRPLAVAEAPAGQGGGRLACRAHDARPSRGRRRPHARPLRRLVRALPALVGRLQRAWRQVLPSSPSSASTSSTCRRSTRSDDEAQGPQQHARRPRPAIRAARGDRLEEGGHDASTRSSGRWRTSGALVARGRELGAEIASTSRSSARPTTPG